MKITEWLKLATDKLEQANIGTARLDVLVLTEDILGKNRAFILAHPEFEISKQQIKALEAKLMLRSKQQPLAYVRGKTEFYGREFIINKFVLEPRPESETMIELLLHIKPSVEISSPNQKALQIIDVGTGSGALAITAKLELPEAEVSAIDIDPKCLEVAAQNAQKHQVTIDFYRGNLLEPMMPRLTSKATTILLCNLPYVPDDFTINAAAMQEPENAIFGGADGLDLYRKLFKQIIKAKLAINYILTESMPPQHQVLQAIAQQHGFKLVKTDDFIQLYYRN